MGAGVRVCMRVYVCARITCARVLVACVACAYACMRVCACLRARGESIEQVSVHASVEDIEVEEFQHLHKGCRRGCRKGCPSCRKAVEGLLYNMSGAFGFHRIAN